MFLWAKSFSLKNDYFGFFDSSFKRQKKRAQKCFPVQQAWRKFDEEFFVKAITALDVPQEVNDEKLLLFSERKPFFLHTKISLISVKLLFSFSGRMSLVKWKLWQPKKRWIVYEKHVQLIFPPFFQMISISFDDPISRHKHFARLSGQTRQAIKWD